MGNVPTWVMIRKRKAKADASGKEPAPGPSLPKLAYSMKEAATVCGVSYMTMHRLIQRGLIKSSSALRTKLIPHVELERFLKDTTAQS
jgi:hypothetical protein